jgi:hypothetical protein
MASLIAMEGAELGAEALPEVEEGAEALESRAVPKMEETEMGRTNAGSNAGLSAGPGMNANQSLQDLFMYRSMQQPQQPQQQPVVINNNQQNYQQQYPYPQFGQQMAEPMPQYQYPSEQIEEPQEDVEEPITNQVIEPTQAAQATQAINNTVDEKNNQTIQTEQIQLNQEKENITELQEQPQTVPIISKLQGLVGMYQKNLSIFQSQLDQSQSIFQQSKNYKFY